MTTAYTKLFTTVTDFSAGIQTVNGLRDNFQAVFDSFAVEHGYREPQPGAPWPPTVKGFGHHNTPRIPRAVVKTTLGTSSFNVVTIGAAAQISVQPVVQALVRFATGQYFIPVRGLLEFYAEVEPLQTSYLKQYLINARSGFGSNGTPVGVVIETYENISNDLTLADVDFSAVIYGTAT